MRKIVIVFCLVLLLAFSVIPAFASSVGGSSSDVYSASAPIDYITFTSTKDVIEWPGNFARRDGNNFYDPDNFVFNVAYRQSVITSDFYSPALNFTFYTENLVVTEGYSLIVDNYYDEEPFTFNTVTVTGYVLEIVPNSTETTYVNKRTRFNEKVSVNSRSCNIGQIVRDVIKYETFDNSYNLPAFVQDLTITVDMSVEAGYNGNVALSARSAIQDNESAMRNWITTRYLEINGDNASYFDATSWLKSSVGAFLDMEIAPGFSINKIFWIILVVGVILWFCTLVI